jgi:hypothetical protein
VVGLRQFLDHDDMVIRTGETVSLDPVRYCAPHIKVNLEHRLACSAAPMTVDALVREWHSDDHVLGSWVPDALVLEVLEDLLTSDVFVILADGRVGLTRRRVLPEIKPWTDTGLPYGKTAEKFAPGVSQWRSEWKQLVASVADTVARPAFRSMRIHARDRSGRTALVTSDAIGLGESVAMVTTSVMNLARGGIGALERRRWWFWDADSANPIRDVPGRLYASELTPGKPFRGVYATESSRGAGEATVLGLRAAQLDNEMTLTLAFDFGPDLLAGLSAYDWARTPRGPTLAYCLLCNRPLSDPESARRGFGPVCWANLSRADQVDVLRLFADRRPHPAASRWAYPLTLDEWLAPGHLT